MKKHRRIAAALAAAMTLALTACGGAKLTGIALPQAPLELAVGGTAVLQATFTYDGETPAEAPAVSYTSADEAVATVDETGTVTAVAAGETTVTAAVGELSATQTVVVNIPTESLAVEELSVHLSDGPVQATVTVEPAELADQLTYKTGDAAIATVDDTGMVTPVKEGHTSLLILAPDGKRAKAMITVWSGPKELTLAADETEVTVDAATLAWSSGDETIATVDETGTVTMAAAGEVTITAETAYEIAGSITLTGKEKPKPTPTPAPAATGNSGASGSSAPASSGSGGSSAAAPTEDAPEGWGTHGWFFVTTDTTAFDLQNQLRAAVGAPALTWDDSLASIAQSRCEDIAVDFSHNGVQTSGENIAVGYADAASVIAAWQGSAGHYANMISTNYTRGAIGHMYDGDGCHYWVAVFE